MVFLIAGMVVATPRAYAQGALEAGLPLGGALTPRPGLVEGWGWTGAWRFPVGDPRDLESPGPHGEPAYRVNRNIGGPEEGTARHQGADLACGHGGGPVRAAAGGVVLVADRKGWNSGYGRVVVLGHRLPDGTGAYSVYAHLAPGSLRVRPGEFVGAGTLLGRVGQSGRATTPHLHFEVRRAESPREQWVQARVLDPVAFVTARLSAPPSSEFPEAPWSWASGAGLLDGEGPLDGSLSHEQWWGMVATAGRHTLQVLPGSPADLRDSLVEAGLLPQDLHDEPSAPLGWNDMERDLARLRSLGVRLPRRTWTAATQRTLCRERFGVADPGREPQRIEHDSAPPTLAAAVIALADVAPGAEAERHHGKNPARKKRATPRVPAVQK
jgi:murein DD-endopeptidase MepM/ murein hydrolase activator NlpD